MYQSVAILAPWRLRMQS